MRYTFTGAFAPHIFGLIEKKQVLGYDYHGSACIFNISTGCLSGSDQKVVTIKSF